MARHLADPVRVPASGDAPARVSITVAIAEARQFVNSVLAAPGVGVLSPTGRHASVLADLLDAVPGLSGNIMHDVHTAVLMREHGIRVIYTRDADFCRFPDIEVADPTAP